MTIYVNFDIETTGTAPGLHSMISLGAIAHRDPDFMCLGHFTTNLQEMKGAAWDPNTEKWWMSPEQAEAYKVTTAEPRETPFKGMVELLKWLQRLLDGEGDCLADGPIVFVAYPGSFDWPFLNYYMQRFHPDAWREMTEAKKDASWSCMCIQSMAATILDKPFLKAARRHWPGEWVMSDSKAHTALEDARAQSFSFVQMMRTHRGLRRVREAGGGDILQADLAGLITMGTDWTGDENDDDPDGVDLGPTTSADLAGEPRCEMCNEPFYDPGGRLICEDCDES